VNKKDKNMKQNISVSGFNTFKNKYFIPRIIIDPHRDSCTFFIGDYVTSLIGNCEYCCEEIVKRTCCYDEEKKVFLQQYNISLETIGIGAFYYDCLTKKYGLKITKIKGVPLFDILPIIINELN
jgi:hypothetical protein